LTCMAFVNVLPLYFLRIRNRRLENPAARNAVKQVSLFMEFIFALQLRLLSSKWSRSADRVSAGLISDRIARPVSNRQSPRRHLRRLETGFGGSRNKSGQRKQK